MPCRDGFVYMGFDPPVIWIKESNLKYYRTEDDMPIPLNVGDQYLLAEETLYLITITAMNNYGSVIKYKMEKVIIVKGQ